MAGINSEFRAFRDLKDCFPPEHTISNMQILVTLSFGIICLSLVFTTIASANVSPVNKVIWKVK